MNDYHIPVLLNEATRSLNIKKGKNYIDCTLGGGGHTKEILRLQGNVLGIDVDTDAIKYAGKFLAPHLLSACPATFSFHERSPDGYQPVPVPNYPISSGPEASPPSYCSKLILHQGNFIDLKKIVDLHQFYPVAGILFDLGVSSHQLETPSRGFSFNTESTLDMRMDQNLEVKALDLVNVLNEGELNELFNKLGEENLSRGVAHALVLARKLKKIETGRELAEIVRKIYQKRYSTQSKINPATKVFQALRIAVNDELNNLKSVLPVALEILEPEGKLVIISFHSLEDRIVKDFFKEKEAEKKLKIIAKHPIVPGDEEVIHNPKSRSAKMRIAEKI